MAVEIERKFLVESDDWRQLPGTAHRLDQGYIRSNDATVRVRTIDDRAFLTIKGRTTGVSRSEFEYEIPHGDALSMLDEMCAGSRLTKTRFVRTVGSHEWVIDEFWGALEGLVMAEVELDSEDEPFEMPTWAGTQVSDDPRYYNSNLSQMSGPPHSNGTDSNGPDSNGSGSNSLGNS
jgi:adenylate cyclase